MRGHDPIQSGEQCAFAIKIFGNSLDDEVHLGQCIQAPRKCDAPEDLIALTLRNLPSSHGPVRRSMDGTAATFERLGRGLHRHNREAVACEHLRDSGAHRAKPDDTDPTHLC